MALAGAIALVLLADGAAIRLQDRATPYAADRALAEFRADGGDPAPTASGTPDATPRASSRAGAAPTSRGASARPGAPAPRGSTPASTAAPRAAGTPQRPEPEVESGVYSYLTRGHEEVDALGGARHDYPAQSTITYRRTGCGSRDSWQPLEGRTSSSLVCRSSSGLELRQSMQRREFFGQSETQELACTGVVVVPDDPTPGATSTGQCRSDDTMLRLTSRVVDTRPLTINGKPIRAVHLRVTGTLTGSTRGSTLREVWLTDGGLLLRALGTTDTDRDTSAGVVRYTEDYELRLESLQPQR